MRTLLWVAVAAGLIAGAAWAQGTPETRPTRVERPDVAPSWRVRPTPEQLIAVWPANGMRRGLSGEAVIECRVSLEGALFDCKAVSEKPAGSGFGAAAVALSPQLLMNPAMKDGKAVLATIRLPIRFSAPGGPVSGVQSKKLLDNRVWLAAPTYAEAVAAFPEKARNTATPGHVVLDCDVNAEGALKPCSIASEEPRGMGFARAARDLAGHFKAPLKVVDGSSTRGMAVHLPITFPIEMLGGAPRVGKPDWILLPGAEDVPADLPKTPEPVTVRVVLDCTIVSEGRLDACTVESEAPAGYSLSAAALAMTPKFALSLWTPEGLPTIGSRVKVPIRFDLK